MVGDQEGRRRRRIGQSPQSLQRRAVLNTLSIKENESLQQRRSSLFQGGFVNYIYSTSSRPHTFWRPFCAFDGTENKRVPEGTRRRRGSNVAPLVSPCKAGYVGRVGGRARRERRGPETLPREMRRQTHSSLQRKRSQSLLILVHACRPQRWRKWKGFLSTYWAQGSFSTSFYVLYPRFSFYVLNPRFT